MNGNEISQEFLGFGLRGVPAGLDVITLSPNTLVLFYFCFSVTDSPLQIGTMVTG